MSKNVKVRLYENFGKASQNVAATQAPVQSQQQAAAAAKQTQDQQQAQQQNQQQVQQLQLRLNQLTLTYQKQRAQLIDQITKLGGQVVDQTV